MTLIFRRRDIGYTIVSRFETFFRQYLSNILEVKYENFLFGISIGIIDKVNAENIENEKIESCFGFLEHTNLIDLMEICVSKENFTSVFPEKATKKDEFRKLFSEIYDLRCRIAHIRGQFGYQELEELKEKVYQLAKLISDENEIISFIDELNENPDSVQIERIPAAFIEDSSNYKIPNNLPVPDYELEGGFVGRINDLAKIQKLIESDLHRVITISGAGGVGKSALALKAVGSLLEKKSDMFDGVIWISAKEDRLTPFGIEELEDPAIKTYEELVDTILQVMGFFDDDKTDEEKEEDLNLIFDMSENHILLIIDNLETITDSKVIDFILDCHTKLKILITSRRGLGQVERRHELKQLEKREAIYLFRAIANDKNLKSLSALDEKTIDKYVSKVFYFPLAIKWLVGQFALGKDIKKTLNKISETTSDISKFCFEEIYNDLSQQSRKILCTLSQFDHSPTAGILNYVVDMEKALLEDGIQELVLVSFVIPEAFKNDSGELETRYFLLPLTKGYVRQQLDKQPKIKAEIENKLKSLDLIAEESNKAKQVYKYSLINMGAKTQEEKVATVYANAGYQKYQAHEYEEAISLYKKAIEIAPNFASIYRNWAMMESHERNNVEAEQLIKKAAELSPDDPIVWHVWGNIKLRCNQFEDALKIYERALELSPGDSVIQNCIGQAYCRLAQYKKADEYFQAALELGKDSKKHDIINRSSLSDNYYRWGEILIRDRNYAEAQEKLEKALENCKIALSLDPNDSKSNMIFRKIVLILGRFFKQRGEFDKALDHYKETLISNPLSSKEINDVILASLRIAQIYFFEKKDKDKAREYLPKDLDCKYSNLISPWLQKELSNFKNTLYPADNKLKGKISKLFPDRKFTIINSIESPDKTYLGHFNDFIYPLQKRNSNQLVGRTVEFLPDEADKKQPRAKNIRLIRVE